MSRCRRCRTPKWKGDLCPNADCPTTQKTTPLRAKTKPVTAAVKHGFHAPTGVTQLLSDYDMPITSFRWRSAS